MNPLDHLNQEALRQLREYERLMKKPGYQKLVDDLSKTPTATQKLIDELAQTSKLNQIQFMEQTLRQTGLESRSQYQTLVSTLAEDVVSRGRDNLSKLVMDLTTAVGPSVYEKLASEIINLNKSPALEIAQKESARVALDMAKMVRELHTSLAPRVLDDLQSLSRFNDSSVRLAMATMRSLHLDVANPLFTDFINKALSQPEPLTKKKIQRLEKQHLPRKKISALPITQQFNLMTLLAILTLLIGIYSAWKMGQPVMIDTAQIAKLSQPPINITNIFQMTHPSEPVHYLVMRDCKLIPKPGKTPIVIYVLSPGAKVKLILTNHQWIYVHYQDGNINKEGWVRKKYLRRLPALGNQDE